MHRPKLRPALRTLVASAFLAALSCSPLEREAKETGPAIHLTAAAPVAEYAVSLCVDGPEIDGWRSKADVAANLHLSADSRQIATRGRFEVGPKHSTFDLAAGRSTNLKLVLDSNGPWSDHEGPRCTEPTTVRFTCDDPTAFTELDIGWKVEFLMREAGFPPCITDPSDIQLSIRIEPLPPP